MTVTSSKTSVWVLDDIYKKVLSCYLAYVPSCFDSGELYAWGQGTPHGIGLDDLIPRSSPTQIPGTSWRCISGGRCVNLALKGDNTLWAWGCGFAGGIGDNTTIHRSSPIQVPGTSWSGVAFTIASSLALKSDNTLWAWGCNFNGTIGDGTVICRSSPVQVPGTSWCFVAPVDGLNSAALKTDGTLWTWGQGYAGQLGNNVGALIPRSSPVQVPGTQWVEVRGGYNFMHARKSDGTLWAWGHNGYGKLGINAVIHRSSPTQIPGTSWSGLGGGGTINSWAKKTNGTLWGWGRNDVVTSIGDNTNINRSSPTQIPGTQWADLGTGGIGGLATKTDSTMWGWGNNGTGRLGVNIVAIGIYSSPVQIPGLRWCNPIMSINGYARKLV